MLMVDSDLLAPALAQKALCQAAFHKILAEWKALPPAEQKTRELEFEDRLNKAERPLFLSAQMVVQQLEMLIDSGGAIVMPGDVPRFTLTLDRKQLNVLKEVLDSASARESNPDAECFQVLNLVRTACKQANSLTSPKLTIVKS